MTAGGIVPTTPADRFKGLLAGLPTRPGVYRMLGAGGEVLYVGKARNLKARVTAYFRASGLTAKTLALTGRAEDIQCTVTGSETEALLLEQSLIKAERPRFNVVLRDDKSYPYIHLSAHPYPRLAFHRGAKRDGRYFGPFPSAAAVRDSLNILQRVFGLRPCADTFFKNRSRPCLQYQIKRCSAPCVGRIDRAQYAEDARLAALFLEGKSAAVLDDFKHKMETASAALEFERAARHRDRIAHLRRVQESQYVHGDSGDADIFGVALASEQACVQGLIVRDGRLLGQRTWFQRNALDASAGEMLGAFVSQYYLGGKREIPAAVVAAEPLPGAALLAGALAAQAGRKVDLACHPRGKRARWSRMANDNAGIALAQLLADRESVTARLLALGRALGWDDMPRRLECFDVSHSSGEATVASCVVFDANGPRKSEYRRFNINGVPAGDDYQALEQAIRRRYTRVMTADGVLPDILVIDGGRRQVDRAAAVLAALQAGQTAQEAQQETQGASVTLLGIAKGPSRKPGLESIVFAGGGELALPASGAATHLLQHLRDEAHRFAVGGHRGRRQKRRRRSALDGIAGVGPRRKRELLVHFGSVASIQSASADEIAKVRGVSAKLAATIHGALHGA